MIHVALSSFADLEYNLDAAPLYITQLCLHSAEGLPSAGPSVTPNATGVLPRKIAAFTSLLL